MNQRPSEVVDGDWWPSSFPRHKFDELFDGEQMMLGRVEFGDDHHYMTVVGMLLDDEELEQATSLVGRFDTEFNISEPDWSLDAEDDEPFRPGASFRLPGIDDIETLVTIVSRSQWDHVSPSTEFLTTYGLVPESAMPDGGLTYLYPSGPTSGVVRVGPSSRRAGFGRPSSAVSYVTASREFVQDYCTLRRKHLAVAYFIHLNEATTPQADAFVGDERGWRDTGRPGRHVAMYRLSHSDRDEVQIEIWGVRGPIFSPGARPVSADDWEYEEFTWPKGTGEINRGFVENVYVCDSVLDRYIDESDRYDVNPVSGWVGHGYQWSVATHGRRGRDTIVVDLKRLNEGTRRSVAEHWNRHAVEAPDRSSWDEPNIASRTAAAVVALQELGEALAGFAPGVERHEVLNPELVYANPDGVDWPRALLCAAASAPADMTLPAFLERAQVLYDAVIAPIGERALRRILRELAPELLELEPVKKMRTLGLLGVIEQLARTAHDAGLQLPSDIPAVLDRLDWPDSFGQTVTRSENMNALHLLNRLRTEKAHGDANKADLTSLGAEPRESVTSWGLVLDTLYDCVNSALSSLARLVAQAQSS